MSHSLLSYRTSDDRANSVSWEGLRDCHGGECDRELTRLQTIQLRDFKFTSWQRMRLVIYCRLDERRKVSKVDGEGQGMGLPPPLTLYNDVSLSVTQVAMLCLCDTGGRIPKPAHLQSL